jgi:hypothetical protein
MRSSLIATILAASIAGIFTFITEPTAGAKSEISKHPANGISTPAAKGNRLDYHPLKRCSLIPERADDESGCVRFADRWQIETLTPLASA